MGSQTRRRTDRQNQRGAIVRKKPASLAAVALRSKLEALAERGVNGEATAAKEKLSRLLKRYDFTAVAARQGDIFAGAFRPAAFATPIQRIADLDIGVQVKWCLEEATKIPCLFHGDQLCAQADGETACRLTAAANVIAEAHERLWGKLSQTAGIVPGDRHAFFSGIFDAMFNITRTKGLLPSRGPLPKPTRAKKKALAPAPGLTTHPYTLGRDLGADIRFSIPLETTTEKLTAAITAALPEKTK